MLLVSGTKMKLVAMEIIEMNGGNGTTLVTAVKWLRIQMNETFVGMKSHGAVCGGHGCEATIAEATRCLV